MRFSDIELPSNRKFGFFFTVIFAVVGLYFVSKGIVILSYMLFILAALFLLITLIKANLLLPLNKLWMQLGQLLGMIVSPIVLGIIFFGLFTPIGFIMRLFKRDELGLKLKVQTSYWKNRHTNTNQTGTFKHQF